MDNIINSNDSMNLNNKNLAATASFLHVFLWLALMLFPLVQVIILAHNVSSSLSSLNSSCAEDYRATKDYSRISTCD